MQLYPFFLNRKIEPVTKYPYARSLEILFVGGKIYYFRCSKDDFYGRNNVSDVECF